LVETDSGYHNDLIIDQFTKQAIPFTQNAAHSAEYTIKRLVTLKKIQSWLKLILDMQGGRIQSNRVKLKKQFRILWSIEPLLCQLGYILDKSG
jgi:hypothetical protein